MLARRSALTVARAGRFYSTASAEAGNEFLAQRAAVKEHAKGASSARAFYPRPLMLGSGERARYIPFGDEGESIGGA